MRTRKLTKCPECGSRLLGSDDRDYCPKCRTTYNKAYYANLMERARKKAGA